MTKYLDPIIDRSASDITNRTSKAFMNVADWVRIYGNSNVLHAVAEFCLGVSLTFDSISSPTILSWGLAANLNKLLTNIERVRTQSSLPAIPGIAQLKTDWAEGGAAESPDYLDVNSWEQTIGLLLQAISSTLDYRVYCGVAAVGQPRFYQARWRQFTGWVGPAASPVRRARTNVAACNVGMTRLNFFRRYS